MLVEFTTGPQNPDFRHALAQLIDYGSDLWQLSVDDFSVGVDRASLAQTPSLVDPIERYIAAVEAVPGGRHLNMKMAARTFDASTAPSAVPALIDAVAALVREVSEPG
jgi:hypothetical protein